MPKFYIQCISLSSFNGKSPINTQPLVLAVTLSKDLSAKRLSINWWKNHVQLIEKMGFYFIF
jgi:hypothetical protein